MRKGFFAGGSLICWRPVDDGVNIFVRDPVIETEVMKGFHGGNGHGVEQLGDDQ